MNSARNLLLAIRGIAPALRGGAMSFGGIAPALRGGAMSFGDIAPALRGVAMSLVLGLAASGCGYAGVATAGDAAVIARNDWLLFGALRKVYVCKITPAGLTQCSEAETP
jgi:hypothetical protein